jgi:hypothetical protein
MGLKSDGDIGPTQGAYNELLCYTLFHYESSTRDALFKLLIEFYSPNEFFCAKTALWELHGDFLGARPARVTTKARPAHEADLNDIIDAVRKFDDTEDDVSMPVFGAINLARLPSCQPTAVTPPGVTDRLNTRNSL